MEVPRARSDVSRLAKLRAFGERPRINVTAGLQKVASELEGTPLSGHLAVVIPDSQPTAIVLDLDKGQAEEASGPDAIDSPPALTIYADRDVLKDILSGERSPVDAFLSGELRYSGDEQLAIEILKKLAQTDDAVFEPCLDESW